MPTVDDLPALSPFMGSIVVGLLAPDARGRARPLRDFGAGQSDDIKAERPRART